MDKITILFAENDPDYLQTQAEFLERAGYAVLQAKGIATAKKLLSNGMVDLAILDLRLEDDDDEKDKSGLILARESDPHIPKIILTAFPTAQAVREALKPLTNGLPPAVDFISKQDGPEILIAAVNRALAVHVRKQPRQVLLNLPEQLEKDYEEARKQAIITHRVRLALIVVGSFVIIGGTAAVLLGETATGVLSTSSGIVAQFLAGIFSKLSENANKRMDKYHRELLKLYMEKK